jgi:hypothetical protein
MLVSRDIRQMVPILLLLAEYVSIRNFTFRSAISLLRRIPTMDVVLWSR